MNRIQRSEAEAQAARIFYEIDRPLGMSDVEDAMFDVVLRCRGLLAATVGLTEIGDGDSIGGVVKLVEDLLKDITRVHTAISAERTLTYMAAK